MNLESTIVLGALSESDALAIGMVAVLGFVFSMLLSLLFIMNRNLGKKNHPLDGIDLEEETKKLDEELKQKETPSDRQPWEKNPDWWKDQ